MRLFIQIKRKKSWRAVHVCGSIPEARFVTNGLLKKYGESRCISKTRLERHEGAKMVQQAEEDVKRYRLNLVAKLVHEYREQQTKSGIDFLLRDIPADLHQKVKASAMNMGISMREFILGAMTREIG